jgi:phosphoglycolate phosphatase
MAIKVVIFDCDGVLFDSYQANDAYYSCLAQALGRGPLCPQEKDYVHVHTVFDSIAHVFRDSPELIEKAHQLREKISYEPFIGLMKPEPGIYECLESLKDHYQLAVLTNRSTTIAQVLAAHQMDKYFQVVISCLDVSKPKPDPEGVLKILAATQSRPEEAAYVGDSENDALTSKQAGTRFIAYKNPTLPGQAWIAHFDQLAAVLKRL